MRLFLAALLLATLTTTHAAPGIPRTGYSLTPRVADISNGDTTVTARFRITDTAPASRFGEGVIFVARQGFPPTTLSSKVFSAEHRTSGDARDGTYAILLDIPDSATTGTWDIVFQLFAEGSINGINDFRIGSLTISDTTVDIGAPTLSNFSVEPATVDLTTSPARITTTFDIADPDATLPPILRLSFGSDAREFYLNHSHLIAGDDTSATYSYAAWLPPGLPPGSYDWSVVTTDDTGTPGSTGKTPDSLERVPAGAPSLTVTNTADAEFGFARNIGDPPILDTLTITPNSIDLSTASPEISGSLGFADDASGLASATLFLTGPTTADHIKLPLLPADITSGNRSEGTIDFALDLHPTARPGTWTIGIDLTDRAGNTTTYGGPAGDSLPPGAPEQITLSNPLPTPPGPTPLSIAGLRFSTREINLTDSPANVGFELDLTDPDASFTSATISATPFIAAVPQVAIATITPADLSSIDGGTSTYATRLHFPLGAIPGPWTVHLEVDSTSNSVAADIGQINVTGFGNIDTTTPTLTTFATTTPTIDVTGAPFTATFTLGLSGFAAPDIGYLSFSNPSHPTVTVGPFPFTTATRTAGGDTASTNTVAASFPAGTPAGTWYPHLTLTDPYYLSSSYGGTDPTVAPPFPTGVNDSVQVIDSGTPPYAAFVANHPGLTDTSPTADPDHDNLPTLIELVLGTDPTTADFPSPLQLTTTATKLRLTFPVDRRALDTGNASPITFSGQISTTLRTRNPLPARSLSGGLYRIETDITPVAPRFLILHATQ